MTKLSDTADKAPLRIRQAVRAVILTPANDLLLVRFEFPTRQVWALPGGGLDPGEDHVTALRRELIEETGLQDPEIGPHIWTREHTIPFIDGTYDGQRGQIYLIRTGHFEAIPEIGWEQMRAERVHEMRWWSYDEIMAGSDIGFAPAALPKLLRSLVNDGIPASPIDTGS
ncbi:MAG: NUDIX domain-containing protein [Actinomycetota bacterium]|uniref:NUDIX hydrolase n=1 Tax=uncultured Ilumatobacter sp. TaxID=879968 RepID=UPI00374FB35E|nr:NUDIX domain-containing protein [Actinomycetota bacterium]